jgi:hypothetical protein
VKDDEERGMTYMTILPGCPEEQRKHMAASVRTVSIWKQNDVLCFSARYHAFQLITVLDEYGCNMIYKIHFEKYFI